MKRVHSLLCLAAAFAITSGVASAAIDTSSFAKHLEVTVPAGSVPSGASLEGVPVLVRLSTDISGFDYDDFKQSGADLAFTDSRGNVLPHDVDTWNADGESLVWVRVPLLEAGAKLHVFYGSDTYSASSSAGVWSGYTGVWHMSEASGTVADATGNGLTATPSGARVAYNIGISDGVVGMARQNGGNAANSADDRAYLSVPSYDSLSLGDTFTASGFFRITGSSGWYRLFSRRSSSVEGGWGQEVNWSDASTVYVYGASGAAPTVTVPGIVGSWVHLAFVYSGSTCTVYANGQSLGSLSITAASDNGAPLSIGCTSSGDDWCLYGDYDEVRLAPGAFSAERIAVECATATNANFLAYGTAETCSISFVDPSSFTKFVQITAASDAVDDGVVLTNFQALVRLSSEIDGFSYSDFLADGSDIVFTDVDGVVLPCEIDTWDVTGESLVWVRIPKFSNGVSLFAYWGSGSPSSVAASETWSGYKGVWHMNTAGADTEPDVSGNDLDATPSGASADHLAHMTAQAGVVGLGRRNQTAYDGSYHNRLLVPSYELGGTFTVSGWFCQKHIYGWHRFMSRKVGSTDAGGWDIEWRFRTEGAGSEISIFGSGNTSCTLDIGSIKDKWVHLAFVYNGGSVDVYTNGAYCATGSITEATDNGNVLAIGGNVDGSERSFEGFYDEVRLGAGVCSADRIAADYCTATRDFFSFRTVGVPAANQPAVSTPIISRDGGDLKVSFSLTRGTGIPKARFTSASGSTDVALEESAVTGPKMYKLTVPSTLAADTTYSVSAVGVNTAGGEVVMSGSGYLYTGTLSVEKTSDASEDGPESGVFTVSRADTYGDLDVFYSLSGSAVAGADYEGESSGVVTIRAGSSSGVLFVTPKLNLSKTEDTTVVFGFSDGLYAESDATAEMTIANLGVADGKSFYKRIDLTLPMGFLGEGERLENFPVLVKLSESIPGFSYSDILLEGGVDLMFTDSVGKVIPWEIDTWNTSGTSLVWVVVPSLSAGTTIRMYYGNGVNTAATKPAGWPGYVGVWHMGEASGTAYDSTTNAYDAVPVQNNPGSGDMESVSDGAVGAGRVNQNGSTFYSVDYENYWTDDSVRAASRRNYMKVNDSESMALGHDFAFSGWFRTIRGTEFTEYLAYRSADEDNYSWNVRRAASSGEDDTSVYTTCSDGGKTITVPNLRNAWVHLAFSFATADDKTTVTCYANGEAVGSGTASTYVRDRGYPLTFGNYDNAADGFAYDGQYDELRLKSGAASANWAKAEYLTVTSDDFVSFGEVRGAIPGLIVVVR